MHYLLIDLIDLIAKELAMSVLTRDISKLTDRYQTTVPSGVRKQLNLSKGDQIRYCTEANGRVYIEAVRADETDPALGAFLQFIEADIKAHPERLQAFDGGLHDRLKGLAEGIEVDLDAYLSPDDE